MQWHFARSPDEFNNPFDTPFDATDTRCRTNILKHYICGDTAATRGWIASSKSHSF